MPSSTPSWMGLPPKALSLLQELYLKLQVLQIRERIWERVLTDAQRSELGPDGWQRNIVPIWMRWRRIRQERAIVELAHLTGFITDIDYNWLFRVIGETPDRARRNARTPRKPHWDRELGQLRWGDNIIRRVRSRTAAHRVVAVLDACQRFGWRKRIPISDPTINDMQLRDAVKSLNVGLSTIRFRSDGTGAGIIWEPV